MTRFPWRRIASFFFLQLLSAIIPLVVLPFVVRLVGPSGWASLSLGYSVGAAAAVLINYGWIVVGPGRVAGVTRSEARIQYSVGLWSRVIVAVPVSLTAAIVSASIVAGSHRWLSVAMSLSVCVTGLTPTWFFIGRGSPWQVALYDTVPKIVGSAVSIPLIALTQDPLMYPLALLVTSLLGVLTSAIRELGGSSMPSWTTLFDRLRSQFPLALSGLIMVGYTSLAVAFVSIGARSLTTVADYAAGSRLRSAAQAGVGAFTSGLQGWASERREGAYQVTRLRAALGMNTAVGAVGGLAFAVLAPSLTSLLFGPEISLSQAAGAWLGVACFLYAMGASLSYHVLGALGATGLISRSTIIASIVGVPLLVVFTRVWGVDGACAATALAELVVVGIQLPAALRRLRRL